MRKRAIKKQIWINEEEEKLLKNFSIKTGLSESEFFRMIIKGFAPKEKPDDRFYDFLKQLRLIGNNLNQIARRVNEFGYIDEKGYTKEVEKLNQFIDEVKQNYLLPEKINKSF